MTTEQLQDGFHWPTTNSIRSFDLETTVGHDRADSAMGDESGVGMVSELPKASLSRSGFEESPKRSSLVGQGAIDS